MRNKFIAIFMALILTLPALANPTEGHIRSSVYEIEAHLSQNLADRISQFSGMDNIWITVKLNVNNEGLKKHLSEKDSPKDEDKEEKYESLPGLNLGPEGAVVKGEDREIMLIESGSASVESSTILAFTTGMDVTVYHRGPLQKKVERLIRSLIEEKISSLNIPVNVKFNHRKARPLEETDLAQGQKIRLESESFAKGLQQGVINSGTTLFDNSSYKYWPYVFFALMVLSLGAMLFMANKAMTSITSVLGGIARAIQSHSSTGNFESKESTLIAEESETSGQDKANGPGQELDVRQKISELYENHAEAISNFIINAMDNKDFHDIWCLSQVLGDKLFFENANITKSKNFKEYNTFLRDNLFSESGPLEYKRLYQKLMGLMLYPNVYFLNSIKKKTDVLSLQDMGGLFQNLTKEEKGVFSEIMDPMKLAALINQGAIQVTDIIDSKNTEIDVATLKKLDQKVAEFSVANDNGTTEKILNVLTYLNQAQYEMHIDAWGMDDAFRFEDLYENKKAQIHEFMKALRVEELCALLPMLSSELQDDIEGALPEIKLARIHQAGKAVNAHSPQLMSRLFSMLLDQEQRQQFLARLGKNAKKSKLSAVA